MSRTKRVDGPLSPLGRNEVGYAAHHTPLTEGRLGVAPSPALVTQVNKVELDDELVGVEEYVLMDIAHALMLTQEKIFDEPHGRDIVRALLALHDRGAAQVLGSDPAVGTLGLQIERYLEDTCGPGGLDIQRARSRIDQKATGWRMINRRFFTAVIGELVALGSTVLHVAERYRGMLVPGYTHLQHSQPTTMDHYLNAHYWNIARNLDRLFEIYDRLNLSPLGGAAYSGTSWAINRSTTAGYLGFSAPIPSARDAGMASLDMGAEIANGLALALSGISRLASDLNYWASSEVGLIQIDASLCGTSSMMPQKRNPIALERIRGLAGSAVGWAASQLGVMHTSTSTDVDQAYVHNTIPSYCTETSGAISLLREAVATVDIDATRMRESAEKNWSTASALADDLTRTHGLSFRAAHETVARFIAAHERSEVPAGTIRVELADAPLNEYSLGEIEAILNPQRFVDSRVSSGATSPASRSALAASAQASQERHSQMLASREESVLVSRARLLADARALVH